MSSINRSDDRERFLLRESTMEPREPMKLDVKRNLLQSAGFVEVQFIDTSEAVRSALFVEAIHEVDPLCHVMTVKGVCYIFVSPEGQVHLKEVREKVDSQLSK